MVKIYDTYVHASLVISARNSSSPRFLVSWVRCAPVHAGGGGIQVRVGQGSLEEVVPNSIPLTINHAITQTQTKQKL